MSAFRKYLHKHRRTILTALPGVLLAAIATWWFLLRGPGAAVRHEAYLRPDTAIRAVLCPARVQSYVSSLAPTATRFVKGIPRLSSMQAGPIHFDWFHKMPIEMAFLFDQAFSGRFGVTLFFQEHPNGEPLDGLIDHSTFLNDLQPIVWTTGIRREPGGKLLAEGQLSIPDYVQRQAASIWGQYQPVATPAIEGSHFLEVAITNSSGALFQIQGALLELFAPWATVELQQNLQVGTRNVLQATAHADLTADDLLEFHVELLCTDPGSAQEVAAVCNAAAGPLSAYLISSHGLALSGKTVAEDAKALADYQLTGFESRLRRALGG